MNRWDKIFESNPDYKPLNQIFLDKLIQYLNLNNTQKSLSMVDLGCGNSNAVFQFANKKFDVTGIDFSKVALKKLQQRIDEFGLNNIKLINSDLNDIKIKLSADIFLCNFVYSFIEKKEEFLQKIFEYMKEESVFILITPVTYKNITYNKSDKTKIAVGLDETLKKLENIFSSVEVYHHDYIGEREDYTTFIMKK